MRWFVVQNDAYVLFEFAHDLVVEFLLNLGIFGQSVDGGRQRWGRRVESGQQEDHRLRPRYALRHWLAASIGTRRTERSTHLGDDDFLDLFGREDVDLRSVIVSGDLAEGLGRRFDEIVVFLERRSFRNQNGGQSCLVGTCFLSFRSLMTFSRTSKKYRNSLVKINFSPKSFTNRSPATTGVKKGPSIWRRFTEMNWNVSWNWRRALLTCKEDHWRFADCGKERSGGVFHELVVIVVQIVDGHPESAFGDDVHGEVAEYSE